MRKGSQHRFEGKTIIVTGAARGIGLAVARHLVHEGAFVYALDLSREQLDSVCAELNDDPSVIESRVLDISDQPAVGAVIRQIEDQRPIDALVNCAGVLHADSFEATTTEDWTETFRINTHGTFFISQCVARHMIERRAGSIVTIASNAASTPRTNMSAYCASKAAVAMLTKCMGLELAKYGIRCNVVSPGSTNTAMLASIAGGHRKLIEGDQEQFRTGIPLGRIAEPEDIAMAVAFLLSNDAKHVTLHELVVDGGATC